MENNQLKHRLQVEPSFLLSDLRKAYQVRLFVGIVLCTLCFGLLLVFASSAVETTAKTLFALPKAAITAVILLLMGMFPLHHRVHAFENEQALKLSINLAVGIVSGFFFLGFQLLTAIELLEGVHPAVVLALRPVFLTALTLHAFLIFTCMIGIFYLWIRAYDAWNDPVKSLLYFSNRLELLRLEFVGYAWYAVGAIWIIVFLVFVYLS